MVQKHFTVVNAQGFHMRPATDFANAMAKFGCSVVIKHNGRDVDGKSLMNIIASCIKVGNEIDVVCDGEGENEALAKAAEMIESGFGE